MKGELNTNQINNLLSSQVVGRLACCDGKFPYIIPISYCYDGNYIFGQTVEGKKLEIIRKNPNIAFQVDSYLDIFNWQSVIIYGQFEELKKDETDYAKDMLLKNVLPLMSRDSIHHHEHSTIDTMEKQEIPDIILFKISINEKTGRFEKQ